MTDAEIFGKLSRIFETHAFSRDNNDDDEDLEGLLEDFDQAPSFSYLSSMGGEKAITAASPSKSLRGGTGSEMFSPNERPKPYEVWQKKHSRKLENQEAKPTPKLTGEQWDRLVDKMHQSNRTKQSAMIKEQNQGLALELGGYLFKPRLNKTSLDLSATMKSLHLRMPEMIAERKKELEAKQKEAAELEVAECTFSPHRGSKKTSDKYLKRMGRKKLTPDDLLRFEEERKKRRELRKQIIEEVESKELTFKPQLSEKSIKLQEKLVREGVLERDPLTRTAVAIPDGTTKAINFRPSAHEVNPGDDARFEDGPMLVIESEHPYRNNTNEFTTVAVPGAVSYVITFHEDTKTEAIHDYVKFFDDERHVYHFGCGKYSGGANGSPYNWPGLDGRPPLVIPAAKFIINFKTNGSINDWGFRMHVIPKLLVNNNPNHNHSTHLENISLNSPAIPNISDAAKHYKPSEKVHERLYKHGVMKHAETHNTMVDLMQNKLNISLKPWETPRSAQAILSASINSDLGGEGNPAAHHYVKLYSKTHLPKAPLSEAVEELLVPEHFQQLPDGNVSVASSTVSRTAAQRVRDQHHSLVKIGSKAVSVVEFDESLNGLWKQLRTL